MIAVFFLLLLSGGYFLGLRYYSDKFSANTQFASINIGNLNKAQAKEKIKKELSDVNITINEGKNKIGSFKLKDLNPKIDIDKDIEDIYKNRDIYIWPLSLFKPSVAAKSLNNKIEINQNKLKTLAGEMGIDNDQRQPATEDILAYEEAKGYYIKEGQDGTTIEFDRLHENLLEGIETNKTTIYLEEAYTSHLDVSDTEALEKDLAKINNYKDINITYLLAGDKVRIPNEKILDWVYLDEAGEIALDIEAIYPYLDTLNEQYSTFGTTREFESTYQGLVSVPPGILGWMIDTELEVPILVEDLLLGKDVERKPEIYSTGINGGEADEIGDTYIEIDLTYQTLFLYVDGVQMLATDIVSGMPGTETIPGANAVNEMLSDTKLVGYNPRLKVEYKVPVSYWIRFDDQDQGIHDASWQWAYGGDVYTYAGSLGCINTPYGAVETLYSYVDFGTPVMVFY